MKKTKIIVKNSKKISSCMLDFFAGRAQLKTKTNAVEEINKYYLQKA